MSKLIHFKSDEELIKTARLFEGSMAQCEFCRLFWLKEHTLNKDGKELQPEEVFLVELCARNLSELYLNATQLRERGIILVSHTFCNYCMRHMLRKTAKENQRRRNHFDCFATAVGNCSQKDCRYYEICVVNKEGLEMWEKRMLKLKKGGVNKYV